MQLRVRKEGEPRMRLLICTAIRVVSDFKTSGMSSSLVSSRLPSHFAFHTPTLRL